MMLKDIIKKTRSKAVIVVVIMIFLFIVGYCVIQPMKKNNIILSNKIESEEFYSVSGDWRITEYLGEGVEYHGAKVTTKAEKSENDKIIKQVKDKYLNKELRIDSKHITVFSPPTELGYHVLNWNELFLIYRQPPNIWDGTSPPFLCVSFSHSDLEDSFDLIIDTNNIATLVVKGQFFRLEKIATDKGVDSKN